MLNLKKKIVGNLISETSRLFPSFAFSVPSLFFILVFLFLVNFDSTPISFFSETSPRR